MKKKLFASALTAALLVSSVPAFAFAATDTATSGSSITVTDAEAEKAANAVDSNAEAPDVLAPVSLTLEGAYKKMAADSPQAVIAKYTLDNENAIAKGYSESLSDLNKADKIPASDPMFMYIDTSSKPIVALAKKFAGTQAAKNYEASMNSIKQTTYEQYYTYKYIEAQVQMAKDNLNRVQKTYDNTMLKYQVGSASKLDTLTAQTNLNSAKNAYTQAVNGFEQMKMGFNIFMGYNIAQKVTLTDSLTAVALPTKTVDASVSDALKNRNEIAQAEYQANMAKLNLDTYKGYPKSSAKYKKAEVALKMAEQGLASTPGTVEMDVRTKYMDMKQKYDAVNYAKTAWENAKETARIGQIQYDNGSLTLTDLSGANLAEFSAQQDYYKAILDYNLAATAYELCSGVGTSTAAIS